MNQDSLTSQIIQNHSMAQAIDGNSTNLTLKFQAAVESALDKLVVADDDGKVTGFNFDSPASNDVKLICEAYRDFQTAEGARRSSLRTPPPPQINLPPSIKPAGQAKATGQPPPNG